MNFTKIGYVQDDVYGITPSVINQVTLSSPVISRNEYEIKVRGRFDCPCCGKGISISIDKSIEVD